MMLTALTVISALGLLLLVGPWSVTRSPGRMVFVYVPAEALAEAVTLKTSVQLLGPAGSEPPVSVTELAVVVTVPLLHCDAAAPVTVNPAGSVSVRSIPVKAPAVAGLVIVIVTALV